MPQPRMEYMDMSFTKKALPADIFKDKSIYPFQLDIELRYQDLDTLGHVNNVAMAGLFEEARMRFSSHFIDAERLIKGQTVLGEVQLFYLAEIFYGKPVRFFLGNGYIGRASWRVHACAFQNDTCVFLADSSLIYKYERGVIPIPDDIRKILLETK
ncbi:MAG: acyl-CoA thioesterase, partial [Alphaproteobacteria bacterium]|nr:acyl-CoA thioesterase [Alphaproteobacteria bacterium]